MPFGLILHRRRLGLAFYQNTERGVFSKLRGMEALFPNREC